jgi:hypothetical protein
MSSVPQRSLVPSQAPSSSRTGMPSRTPVQVLASALLLATNGERGVSSQGGRQTGETSGGQRPWASSSLPDPSLRQACQASFSESLATTAVSLKAGGREGVGTGRPMGSSGASTTSRMLTSALLSRVTSPVVKTQQMVPQEESTLQLLVSSQLSAFQNLSGNLSSTSITNLSPADAVFDTADPSFIPSPAVASPTNRVRHSTNADCLVQPQPVIPATRPRLAKPSAYQPTLCPLPSPLRPHCLARDRLRLWIPSPLVASRHSTAQEDELCRVFDVMSNAWASSTRESYSAGLLVYHVYCDKKGIPEELRAPTSQHIVTALVASLAGSYSGSTISNYIHGIRAWHILHGLQWRPDHLELDAVLRAAERLTPSSSKRKKRQPYTPEFIARLRLQMALEDPFDAAVFACLTTCFYAAARVGEFVVPRLDSFSPSHHVTIANVRVDRDPNGLEVAVLHLPHTKAAPLEGEDVYWSSHPGPTDPFDALENHRRINNPPQDSHLFAYQHKGRLRPLTKTAFIKRLGTAALQAGLEPLQGHGIRIGATLFYLLQGMPIEAMKVMGRWSSDAFLAYLRKHAQILTPLIQANPVAHQGFSQFIIPSQALLQGRK